MRKSIILLLFLITTFAQGQTVTLYPKTASNTTPFVLVKPTDYSSNVKYPLYVFLHGVGGRGDGSTTDFGLNKLVQGELPPELQAAAEKYKFVILAPQITGDWGTSEVNTMIAWSKSNLSINWTNNRNVITGLSLGGGGVWRYISSSVSNAQNFATAVIVCGLNWVSNAKAVADSKIAVWAFHAKDDGTVNYNNAVSAVNAVNGQNPTVAAYLTSYTSGNHYIWGRVYNPETKPGTESETVNVYEYAVMNQVGKPVPVPKQTPVDGLVADAGADLTTSSPNVNLNGLNSSGYVSAGWSLVDYPSGVNPWSVITSGGGWITGTAKLPVAGKYTFRLTIKNSKGAQQSDDVVITYDNGTPPPTPVKKLLSFSVKTDDSGGLIITLVYSDGSTVEIK